MENEEEEYEEPPWEGSQALVRRPFTVDVAASREPSPVSSATDEFAQYLNTLQTMVRGHHFPEELYLLLRNEMTDPYNKWLRGLRGQPLEYSILQTLRHVGFFDEATRRIVIPEASVVLANARLEEIDQVKKTMNYVIHRIQEYRLNTNGGVTGTADGDGAEESKTATAMDEYRGHEHNTINSILAKMVLLADNLYKIMDSASIMCLTLTHLLENAHPDKWFRSNDLLHCDFAKFLYLSRPIAMEDSKKFDRHTRLVIFLLDKFRERKFRKKVTSEYLYKQIFFTREDGNKVCTYCYSPIKENIEQLVYDMVRKEYRGDLWSTILHAGILKDVILYIRKCVDEEVPEVREMPRMWSFEDGIYCAETDTFAYYSEVHEAFPMLTQGFSTYKFMKGHTFAHVYFIEEPIATSPRARRSRARGSDGGGDSDDDDEFHEDDENDKDDEDMDQDQRHEHEHEHDQEDEERSERIKRKRALNEIQMPNLVKIFEDQGWTPETIFLKFATLGRTFWPAGALDNCQYWPCDWGVGGSGKSTVQDVFKHLFHWQDVGIFGADQEDTFSRDSLPDKRIIIAPEVRGDNFGCSLAFFLSIVAGDSVRIPVKYGQPRDVENFNVQGLMATNELPKSYMNDPKGSVARRILVFPWPRVISPRDPTLKTRIIRDELPSVLRACVVAYQMLPKDVDIMSDYPLSPEMASARARLQKASNSMVEFLLSEDYVTLGDNLRTEIEAFRKTYNYYVKEVRNDRHLPPWNEDLYDYPFRLLGLHVEAGDENSPPYVVGCSLRVEMS